MSQAREVEEALEEALRKIACGQGDPYEIAVNALWDNGFVYDDADCTDEEEDSE